jgi:phosphoribosyl 1,2-cyclic phosphodiesterase
LCSHHHSDHSRYVKDVLSSRIPVYTSETAKSELGIDNNILLAVEPDTQFQIDDFSVIPFDVRHDVRCFGYLIRHEEGGVILFATDCCYLPNKFIGLNNILIECNYRRDILDANTREGLIPRPQRDRTLQSHMSYDTCLKTLLANDLSKVNNIVLIHLSDGNSNANEFRHGIHEATNRQVYVAQKGMTIEFNKTPF